MKDTKVITNLTSHYLSGKILTKKNLHNSPLPSYRNVIPKVSNSKVNK